MFTLQNTYAALPPKFFAPTMPAQVPNPKLLNFNHSLAQELGICIEDEKSLENIFSGQQILPQTTPIALAYAGHQFGQFVPQLGDGRAILLGEIESQGKRYDIQLKGAGRTPFSRGGDGLAPLGPVIREYILSEAMHALGVPTTRALAAVTTGNIVHRRQASPGAIFTRVASSHIRIGTFEYFASQEDNENLKILADYAIDRHYPHIKDDANPYLSFFHEVLKAQSNLVTTWMSFGFIHGVMNTDNTSISGETIDYGPCAFMDEFLLQQVFSSIDHHGRYCYRNQASIILWNLSRLADCLVPLIDSEAKKAISHLEKFLSEGQVNLEQQFMHKMGKKLGLHDVTTEDYSLIELWLDYLETERLDFTLSFRTLINLLAADQDPFFPSTSQYKNFQTSWHERVKSQNICDTKRQMEKINPIFIPRNHQVERAIQTAINNDFSVFKELNEVLASPYKEQPKFERYKTAPLAHEKVTATFCGT